MRSSLKVALLSTTMSVNLDQGFIGFQGRQQVRRKYVLLAFGNFIENWSSFLFKAKVIKALFRV